MRTSPRKVASGWSLHCVFSSPALLLIVPRYRALAEAGVQYFIVALWRQDTNTMELFAKQVMPNLQMMKGK